MADPNMIDFYRRVDRLQKARAKGYGFEAPGTLGRSFYQRPARPRRSILAPAVFLILALIVLKGAMIAEIGRAEYQARVERLQAGNGVELFGGWLMQIDPGSEWVAAKLAPYLAKLN